VFRCKKIQLRRVRVDFICKNFTHYDLLSLVTFAPCQASSLSCSLNRRSYTPKVSFTLLPKAPVYPLHFSIRFSPLAPIIHDAV
jgi:hypothetical protein